MCNMPFENPFVMCPSVLLNELNRPCDLQVWFMDVKLVTHLEENYKDAYSNIQLFAYEDVLFIYFYT